MTEQVQLNVEQEAFLAYQAAATNRLESSNKITEAFNAYIEASKAASTAYDEYVRITAASTAAYEAYLALMKADDAECDRVNDLYNKWVKVRGY
jgi:hypothetical protein